MSAGDTLLTMFCIAIAIKPAMYLADRLIRVVERSLQRRAAKRWS